MKKSLTIILMITILIMPLVFAIRITGSAPQNEEDVENYEEDFCEINDCVFLFSDKPHSVLRICVFLLETRYT